MIILLDTATPICKLTIIYSNVRIDREWQADRELAKGLLGWLHDQLEGEKKTMQDIEGIGVLDGPGSFTGLRIGLTVANTLSDSLAVPIVGVRGEDWQDEAIERLQKGDNDKIVMPFYGADANITTPRK